MKVFKTLNFAIAGLLISTLSLLSQEITIEEAFDTTGISWTVAAGPLGGDTPTLTDENYWHPVTDETWDGVDALSLRMPDSGKAHSDIRATIAGPVQFSFWYKTDPGEIPYLHTFWIREGTSCGSGFTTLRNGEWTQYTASIREAGNFVININVNGDEYTENWDAWIDNFTTTNTFPPEITEFPEFFPVPLGKESKLEVEAEGFGAMSYKWFKDGEEIPGESAASIIIPSESETGEFSYRVEVTDEFGTVMSDPATVKFFDLSDVLDNELLEFSIPDLSSQNYSSVLLTGEDAPDGEDAVHLRFSKGQSVNEFHTTRISTLIEGPVIVSYLGGAPLVPDENLSGTTTIEEEGGTFRTYFSIISPGSLPIQWTATPNLIDSGSASLDQVKLSKKPVLFQTTEKQTTVVGIDRILEYEFLSVGSTTHQLLRNDQVVVETTNDPINLESLQLNQSGNYKLRIANEFGEEVLSEEVEIVVADTIGDAVEQPDLVWHYEGANLWVPQIFETYDGEDAAMLLNEKNEYGAVSTEIQGPAFVSFWWKRSPVGQHTNFPFRVATGSETDMVLAAPGDSWEQAQILITAETNQLKWSTGIFLDRLQIEYLDDDPFKLWAFQKFEANEVLLNFAEVRDGDRDLDGFTNFLEWALNKNLDFPNGTQKFEIIEIEGQQYLGITYTRPAGLGSYSIHFEATSNLDSWERIESVVSETFNPLNNTITVTVRDTQALDLGGRFIRLVVTDES